MFKRPFRFVPYVTLIWLLGNMLLVVASWSRSYFTPIASMPQAVELDLRSDRIQQGRVVTIIATKPTPSEGDYIGHLWIAWPETPSFAPTDTYESGYYATNQLEAALTLAGAIWAPWGFLFGHAPVSGRLKVDDGRRRHIQIDITIDEARYQAALAVDAKWRRETRYSLRPGIAGFGQGQTWACQDYILDVAAALGMKATNRDWTHFPMESFLAFVHENNVTVIRTN